MTLEQLLCDENATLFKVLRIINENLKGTAFIVNKEQKLKGVVTDGDIRRALLAGFQLDNNISGIIHSNFVYGLVSESYSELLSKVNNSIKILPILNEEGQVVDYFEYRTDITVPVSLPYLRGNELKYLTDAFLSTWISSTGKYIEKFEKEFSNFIGCRYGVAVTNGTVALHLALTALGIGEGDEVIVPDLTFAATINAVLHTNARPVIVDVEDDSWCIDPLEIEKAITSKTKAIIPVHLYGQPCAMDKIMQIANKYNIYVIEDCAEAHGAMHNGRKVGTFGHISCFSFFANKIITTGEGGMCVTNDKKLSEKMKILRDHGMSKEKKYWHNEIGFNYRMTNLQAAIGVAQLEGITDILEERETIAKNYIDHLTNIKGIEFQKDIPNRQKVVWLFSILVGENVRDEVIEILKVQGFDVRLFFYSLSSMHIYEKYAFSNSNSKSISKRGINLPTYVGLSENEIRKICTSLKVILNS